MNERQDLDDLLAEMYVKLRDQQQLLTSLLESTMALVAPMRELNPEFEAVYAKHYEDVKNQLQEQGLYFLPGSYDEMIRRLRRNQ